MDASPFGKLSGELRNRVYHFFFLSQLADKFHVDIRNDRPRLRSKKKEIRSALALTATNRQFRRETLAIFWSTASFRIVADTLTAYSYSNQWTIIQGDKPMNRAYNTNKDRAATLKLWLKRSGLLRFTRILRPMELDLGVWDPRVYARGQQPVVLRLIEGSVTALTAPLRYITSCSLNTDAECTLVFTLSLQPSTAMGPIKVPNDRKQALAVVEELCKGRLADAQATFQKGLFTRHGYSVIFNDINSCRAVADLLVGYIAEEKEEESEESEGSNGGKSNSSPGGEKGKRSGN
ncbi:hypothetical protein Q7P35_012308 [Cladosporium inversicolor]